jgi:transposase
MVASLLAENSELRARLAQNSSNSSKPPSSDPPSAPLRRSREPSGKPRGGQPGHKKHDRTLLPPERVLAVQDLKPEACRRCGGALSGVDAEPHRHQVIDVPKVLAMAVEYRQHSLRCDRCCITTQAELPAGVPATMIGPRLQAMVAVMSGAFRMSKRMIEEMLEDFFSVQVSLGTIANTERRTSDALADPFTEAAEAVRADPVVHADETGWRERLKKAWLWVAATPTVAVFLIRRSRGGDVARELLGANFGGTLVSDRWCGYAWVDAARRQLCWAHLKRHFKAFEDYGPHARRIGKALQRATRKLFHEVHRVRDGTIQHGTFRNNVRPLQRRIESLLGRGAACPSKKVAGMCREILELRPALWTFLWRPCVDPTNNHGERVLRHAVVWRKSSGGTDTETGSRFVERVLTVVQTLRLQRRHVLEYMVAAVEASLLGRRAPSLLQEQPLALAAAA